MIQPKPTRICARPGCGKTFTGIASKRFCSRSCGETVWRKENQPPRIVVAEKAVALFSFHRHNGNGPRCACGTTLYWPGEIALMECLSCRNERRRHEYKGGKFIYTKGAGRVTQASRAKG